MAINWKPIVLCRAELWLSKQRTPLFLKEIGWRLILLATRCGKSNPISFVLRLVFDHKRTRVGIGAVLVLGVFISSVLLVPLTPFAANTGGKLELATLSEGEFTPRTELTVQTPLVDMTVSQGYWLFHPAIDLAVAQGSRVKPVMSGQTLEVGKSRFGYGNYVMIDHLNGYTSRYAHLSEIWVQEGHMVNLQSTLGLSGSTGRSTGPHLHLEIHYEGKSVNPAVMLGIK